MTAEIIQTVQALLTVSRNGDQKTIVNVRVLLKRHGAQAVISLLKGLLNEKRKILVDLFNTDESRFEIDETIGAMFRLNLAIKRLELEADD